MASKATVGFIPQEGDPKPKRDVPKMRLASSIEPKPVYWMWAPYIPQGMVTLISGDPGLGKSWMTMSIAADVSAGRPLPGSKVKMPPRRVLVMNYEDSLEHTVVPRLISLGANLDNVIFPDRYFPLDPEGIALMSDWLNEASVGLVFIDPIVAALGAKVDMHKANEVRAVMSALAEIAARSGAAIIAVRHLRKSGRGDSGKAIYAGLGSIDFTGAARSELLVEATKQGDRVVRHIKCNVGPLGPTLAYHYSSYTTEDKRGEPVQASRFEWLGLYEGTDVDDTAGTHVFASPQRDAAREWIRAYLAGGARLAVELNRDAQAAGFSLKTLKRAKEGIARSAHQEGVWYWELCPESGCGAEPMGFLSEEQLEAARLRLRASSQEAQA